MINAIRLAFTDIGTFKFIYDGERLQPQDTPASVRQPTALPFGLTHGRAYQHGMESGDIVDAHLEQVRTGVTFPGYPFPQVSPTARGAVLTL